MPSFKGSVHILLLILKAYFKVVLNFTIEEESEWKKLAKIIKKKETVGMNMKNVLSFQNCSLSVGLYFYVLFHLKKSLIFRCELLYNVGGHRVLEFRPAPVCEETSRTWSHNPRWPKIGLIHSLQTLQTATWNLCQNIPCLGPCSNLEILLLTYWRIHWQVLLQKLCPSKIQIMSSGYCNSDEMSPFWH